jgi:hypothetical protein
MSSEYWSTGSSPPKIERFSFAGHTIQVVIENSQPLFSIVDVCKVLDIDPISQSPGIDTDWHGTCEVMTEAGLQKIPFIREPALYALVINAQSPVAANFYRWIFDRLMPLISQSIVPIDLPVSTPKFAYMTSIQYIEIAERVSALECPLPLKKALFDKIGRDLDREKPPQLSRTEDTFLSPVPTSPPRDIAAGHDRTMAIEGKSLEIALGVSPK